MEACIIFFSMVFSDAELIKCLYTKELSHQTSKLNLIIQFPPKTGKDEIIKQHLAEAHNIILILVLH